MVCRALFVLLVPGVGTKHFSCFKLVHVLLASTVFLMWANSLSILQCRTCDAGNASKLKNVVLKPAVFIHLEKLWLSPASCLSLTLSVSLPLFFCYQMSVISVLLTPFPYFLILPQYCHIFLRSTLENRNMWIWWLGLHN